jgi:hypothetical protein
MWKVSPSCSQTIHLPLMPKGSLIYTEGEQHTRRMRFRLELASAGREGSLA